MTREELLLRRVRDWDARGLLSDRPRWLEQHGLITLLPDLYGPAEAARWRRRILAENMILQDDAARILGMLTAEGIPAVVLKGLDLLSRIYAGREADRRIGDIDILVAEDRLADALRLVESSGFRQAGLEPLPVLLRWSHQIAYEGPRKLQLEVHRLLSQDMGFTVSFADLARAGLVEPGEGPGGSYRLALPALVVHLLVHLAAHRFGGDSLRWVLDVLILLDRAEERLDGDVLAETARALRGRRAAGAAVAAIARLVPGVDLGPLAALRRDEARERLALWLVDPERVALRGEAGFRPSASVASRLLLDPAPWATVRRKLALVRGRRRHRRDA